MTPEVLVAGVDSSTQSTKVLLVRASDGVVVDAGAAPHPPGTEVDPEAWWSALQDAGRGLLDRAAAIGVAGQQHGMVALDDDGAVIRPALLWNDLRSAPQVAEVVEHLGGPQATADAIGSVPAASFTVTKLRWLAEHEPDHADRTRTVLLPHDWLTWRLAGGGPGGASAGVDPVTDAGDASGTGYWSPATRSWLPEVARWALGRSPRDAGDQPLRLPRIAAPAEVVGRTATGAALSAGSGDNMCAALGLGIEPGDVVVSIGTSGTAFCIRDTPTADPTGSVAGFADATRRYLPLVCTLNAAKILDLVAGLLGVGHAELADLALAAPPGANGLTLLPYLDGERTPNRPSATGILAGLTSATGRPDLARAAVEALLASLADAVDALGVRPGAVLLIGGAARNPAVQQLAPAIFGVPVAVPDPAEYVALGAARQAAWALNGTHEPPTWAPVPGTVVEAPPDTVARQRYGDIRDATASWTPAP